VTAKQQEQQSIEHARCLNLMPVASNTFTDSRALPRPQWVITGVDVEKVGAVFGFRGLNSVVELVGIALPPMKWREPVTSLVG
jgi:hypothetical protein